MTETVIADASVPIPSLAKKIVAVQLELAERNEQLKKRHVVVTTQGGGSYSYDYIEEATLMNEIRLPLAKQGVAVFYSDRVVSMTGNLATVAVSLRLIDSESGESLTMTTEGIGTDKGDKMVDKAKTAALRYLLWKWFLIPSDIDPETENEERTTAPPASHVKMAKTEDVDQFLADVAAAGFDPKPQTEQVDELVQNQGGVPVDWLARQRRDLESAKPKAPPAS